jgi:hypothetical protein
MLRVIDWPETPLGAVVMLTRSFCVPKRAVRGFVVRSRRRRLFVEGLKNHRAADPLSGFCGF